MHGPFSYYLSWLRDQDLHLGLEVMSLPRYCFSIPLFTVDAQSMLRLQVLNYTDNSLFRN